MEEKDSLTKVEKNQNPQKQTDNPTYIIYRRTGKRTNYRPTNTHFRRAAHSNEKMSPQDLKNTLIQPEETSEEEETYDLTEMEEYDLTGPGEPVYETPIMTPQLYRRIMVNEFSQDQVEYIIKKALKN